MNDARQPGRLSAALIVFLLGWAIAMVCLTVAIGMAPLQDIRERVRIAQWPQVQATITQPQVHHRRLPPSRHRPGTLDTWCAGWGYDYVWQGRHRGGALEDDTSGPQPYGCYLHESGARNAALARAPGSTLAIRVDPADPWNSTAQSTDIPARDIEALAFGLLPLLAVIGMLATVAWRGRAVRR